MSEQQGPREVTLPSGRAATIRRGKGRDVLRASRMVDVNKEGEFAIALAGLSLKVTVEGKPLTYEDVLELPEEDVWFLLGEMGLGKSSPPNTSPS